MKNLIKIKLSRTIFVEYREFAQKLVAQIRAD